ncbi:TonB-dependent receptor [Exilibacterium tricleocarpae]|uniref:TonB-dependent receptor n=1 Tax=Exilibacterium tricleocarpae TaxID=2591008 RepID=A0A545T8E9_9GAMM|nr:TonB-dependent receptor [Exilibacterium tricleocarpae]TQV73503.1 TonB-dependent receptor [Exilibacterium tricleocarpae]
MRNLILSFICLSTVLSSVPGFADDKDGQDIETVSVIGKRQAYQGAFDYQEVPAASQEIDLELIHNTGVLNLSEALDLSATVARQNNFGGLWNSFAIRGFAGDENLPSGFLVNGFNAGRGFGGPRDLVGIERVDVLKGPKAALFGRGEPGGAVNLVTKRPTFEQGGEIKATYGSWEQIRFETDLQTVLDTDDKIGVRFVGFVDDAESFRKTVETKRVGLYPSIAWEFSENTSATYELEFTEQELPFDRGVVSLNGRLGVMPIENFVGEPGDGDIETEVVGHQLEVEHKLADDWTLLAGLGLRDTTFTGFASEPNFEGRQTLFLDGRTLSRFRRFRDFDTKYVVMRAEISGAFSTGNFEHRIVAGADYDRFENDQVILRYRPLSIPSDATLDELDLDDYIILDILNPVYGAAPLIELDPITDANRDRLEVQKAWGIYIQDQIAITDQLQIRLGGRFDDFEKDLDDRLTTPTTTSSQSDSRFSPQVGAVYLMDDYTSIYATYGEGFRQLTESDFAGNPFAPNKSKSSEIGIKTDLQGFFDSVSGVATLSVFNVEQSNILVFDDRPEASDGFFLRPAGKAESRGLELDINARLPGDVDVWFSYAYIDAEYTNDNPDANFGAAIEEGDPLINVPENQLSVQVSKGFVSSATPIRVGAGALYVGERLGQTASDFYLPSYTTVRAFAEFEPSADITIRLDIDNLFDKEFYTNSFADVWIEPGAPRRARLTATLKF